MLWHHQAPWEPEARSALLKLQGDLFVAEFDYSKILEDERVSVANALRLEQESGDRFGLVEIWSQSLRKIESLANQPIPKNAADQVSAIRTILSEGFGSILDVTDVNESGGIHLTRFLSADEIADLFGTKTPTARQVEGATSKLLEKLDRGESLAFAVFDDAGNPKAWNFTGLTAD